MDDVKLKNCPFCSGRPKIEDHRTIFTVVCTDCGVTMLGKRAPEPDSEKSNEYWQAYKENAIAKWNRRV